MSFTKQQKQIMLSTARQSIEFYLSHKHPLKIELSQFDAELNQLGASFVTLKKQGELRGCIGHLMPVQPLIEDIANNAIAAATQDYRFEPLQLDELNDVKMDISVLSSATDIYAENEADLYSQLHVGQDGLILKYQNHQATFLPSVWHSLKSPELFARQLKIKAGLAENFWCSEIHWSKYSSQVICDDE